MNTKISSISVLDVIESFFMVNLRHRSILNLVIFFGFNQDLLLFYSCLTQQKLVNIIVMILRVFVIQQKLRILGCITFIYLALYLCLSIV